MAWLGKIKDVQRAAVESRTRYSIITTDGINIAPRHHFGREALGFMGVLPPSGGAIWYGKPTVDCAAHEMWIEWLGRAD